MIRKLLLIQALLFTALTTLYSQKNTFEIGGKFISELADWSSYGPGIGLQSIYKMTRHSGIETGVYYKINPKSYLIVAGPSTYSNKKFIEKVIQVPLLYRFESRLINFTAGAAVDYLLNMEKLKKNPPLGYSSDDFYRFELISTISVSKSFYLNHSLVFEPEFRASAFVPAGGGGLALNLSLRKKLN